MGGASITYGKRREVYAAFWWANLRERDHVKDPDVDGRIILKWIFKSGMWWRGSGGGHL
jgi:hypothetical protein